MSLDKDMIYIHDLMKIYGKEKVLEIEELHLKRGKIYGLVGDNGAGKTTLFRQLAGIDFPTKGSIEFESDFIKKAAVIEQPVFDLDMTGYENLKFMSLMCGYKGNDKIYEMLDLVKLNAGKKKVKKYSLGMKQRLGLAMVLMQKPDILFLDEPLNGIDPHGVLEFRKIISEINKKGVTIVISSHILSELYKVATDFIFLKNGRVVKELSSEEIDEQHNERYILRTNDNQSAVIFLKTLGEKITMTAEGDLILSVKNTSPEEIMDQLKKKDIYVQEFFKSHFDLETYYKEIL